MFGALLYKILEIFNFKQGTGKTFGPGRRRAVTSRVPRATPARHVQLEALLTEAAASLGVRALMRLVFNLTRVASPSRRTHAAHRADRRTDPRAIVRASVEMASYHGGIFVVSTPSPPSAYLRSLSVLVRAIPSRPTLVAPPAMDIVATEH
jgi:hypothetical protein